MRASVSTRVTLVLLLLAVVWPRLFAVPNPTTRVPLATSAAPSATYPVEQTHPLAPQSFDKCIEADSSAAIVAALRETDLVVHVYEAFEPRQFESRFAVNQTLHNAGRHALSFTAYSV